MRRGVCNIVKVVSSLIIGFLYLVIAEGVPRAAEAHGTAPWAAQRLDWSNEQIGEALSYGDGKRIAVEGRECLNGTVISFDVRDDYAYNINETVWLDLEVSTESAGEPIGVSYDQNGVPPPFLPGLRRAWVPIQKDDVARSGSGRWQKRSIRLKHARFANLGFSGTDFSVYGSIQGSVIHPFTMCGMSIRRTYETVVPESFGRVDVEVHDENGAVTPVRMGIYDSSGRLALPSDEAILVRSATGATRVLPILPEDLPWTATERSVFYSDGRYYARLPVGSYELVASKGPEYRLAKTQFKIAGNGVSVVKLKLTRWANQAAHDWYSGEAHIHYTRSSRKDNISLQQMARAEDLHVANILAMGNIAKTYFDQYDWEPVVDRNDSSFALVPGQEDPRTSRRGHTINLNIRERVRVPTHYLLYHEVFEKVRALGGLSGYAHVTVEQDRRHFATRGLAIDVPFGLVSFVEILSGPYTDASIWFDFLNLGYKLPPAAGTDFPWGGLPGSVRNYVKVNGNFTPRAWYDQFRRGHTFVTRGPMLEMSINGKGMGSQVDLKGGERVVIKASASLNPDVDALASLELVEQGEIVKTVEAQRGAQKLEFSFEPSVERGTWFVLRAKAMNPNVAALTAPIYVSVDGDSFWKPEEVAAITEKLKKEMQGLLSERHHREYTEPWETTDLLEKSLDEQESLLSERIRKAAEIYDGLAARSKELLESRR